MDTSEMSGHVNHCRRRLLVLRALPNRLEGAGHDGHCR
jgi:hypothetical protein